jgi:hypothetical protein
MSRTRLEGGAKVVLVDAIVWLPLLEAEGLLSSSALLESISELKECQ